MSHVKQRVLLTALVLGLACAGAPPVYAQFAVIDVAAVAQLVMQLQNLEEQLLQAKAEFDSITGGRGMERLLAGAPRNYLPADWAAFDAALRGGAAVGGIAGQIAALVTANAVLSDGQLVGLSPVEREQLDRARRTVAMLQVMARDALSVTSARFASLQQLIDAIPGAVDQKGVLDLQARIQVEQGMLQNESTKLQILFKSAQAEEWSRRQRAHEDGIAAVGSLRRLPPLGL